MAGRGSGGWKNSLQRAGQRRSPVFYGRSRAPGGWFSSISGWVLQSERGVARAMAGDARCRVRVRQPGEAMRRAATFRFAETNFVGEGRETNSQCFTGDRGCEAFRFFQVFSGFFRFFQVGPVCRAFGFVRFRSEAFGGVRCCEAGGPGSSDTIECVNHGGQRSFRPLCGSRRGCSLALILPLLCSVSNLSVSDYPQRLGTGRSGSSSGSGGADGVTQRGLRLGEDGVDEAEEQRMRAFPAAT